MSEEVGSLEVGSLEVGSSEKVSLSEKVVLVLLVVEVGAVKGLSPRSWHHACAIKAGAGS